MKFSDRLISGNRIRARLTAAILFGTIPVLTTLAERPDSVYLHPVSSPDGTGGLRLEWSATPEGTRKSVGDGFSLLGSDFGPWGTHKKMFEPRLSHDPASGEWICEWFVTPSHETVAVATTRDFIRWSPQRYLPAGEWKGDGKEHIAVPLSVLDRLKENIGWRRYRDSLNAETTKTDAERFHSLTPLKATLSIHDSAAYPISQNLIGIFFEDINYAADGGLYAELIQNRDFEYKPSEQWNDKEWNALKAWYPEGDLTITISTDSPLSARNPTYLRLRTQTGGSLRNSGFDGITARKGEKYDFSMWTRKATTGKTGPLMVRLLDASGNAVASAKVSIPSTEWKQIKAVLSPSRDISGGSLELVPAEDSELDIDLVSLFPRNTFKGRHNGLREDLASTLAALHPRFVRFPGGCVAHGNDIDNIYDWKGSVGPLQDRRPIYNVWGYHQTRGLGYHEYFQFCEDIGAEPVPVVAAGVPCQNSGRHWHGAKDELTLYGQQGGIPMEDMDAYVQDILDLIEYANGDPKKSKWAKMRAEAGHPAPFGLKYIGIGNEDMITEVFEPRYRMIFDAVEKKWPDVKIIGTVGPWYEGTDFNEGWKLATDMGLPLVDEHYYVSPGWMIHNQDFYDDYDRSKPHVYLGEYAAHLPGRPSNIEVALAEALWLTGVERNGDVVEMASYAPLLAKRGRTQWIPDLIYFTNDSVMPTPNYDVQRIYGEYPGKEYLPSDMILTTDNGDARLRVARSVVRSDNGDLQVRLVNLLPVEVDFTLELPGDVASDGTAIILSGSPDDTTARAVDGGTVSGSGYVAPAYSFTNITFHKNNTDIKK